MQSELHFITLSLEVRIWARNVVEREEIAQETINQLRSIELDSDGTVNASIFGFEVTSATNVDENAGNASIRSRVLGIQYKFVLGG